MILNHVVVVFDNGTVVKGVITATHNDNGAGIWLQQPGAQPSKEFFSAMTSITVIA